MNPDDYKIHTTYILLLLYSSIRSWTFFSWVLNDWNSSSERDSSTEEEKLDILAMAISLYRTHSGMTTRQQWQQNYEKTVSTNKGRARYVEFIYINVSRYCDGIKIDGSMGQGHEWLKTTKKSVKISLDNTITASVWRDNET